MILLDRLRWRFSANRFQPFNHTLPDRYPWLFSFVRDHLGDGAERRLLSFGCSTGLEALSLRRYFPKAAITGLDISPANIAACRRHGRADIAFAVADSTAGEAERSYDAIFCLAVLCHGTLTATRAERCDPLVEFATFERMVADFARCLKPGGLLCLVTTNFRFADTATAAGFTPVLDIDPALMAPDLLYGRDNRLLEGERYTEVVFVKNHSARTVPPCAP
ncbi:MAG TPA: class I SAM-dependent methyltransferase [Magnetospirillaceae bacterium]|nr:class I SAM-dependent methyltransferase [Magnetospirillaceae bacterium]